VKLNLTNRQVFAGFAIVTATLLAVALLLQHFAGHRPCPLCIMQREGFLLTGLIALAAVIHNPGRRGALVYLGAMLVAVLAGMGVAIRHIWVLHHPSFGCGIDVLEQIVNGMFVAKLMPWFFYASGGCSDYLDPVLGLNVPEWAFTWYVILCVAVIFFLFRWRSASGRQTVKPA
jgi:protein dithiol:quinone oxidoreductase